MPQKKPSDDTPSPASLATAAYDLWQEQWQLLRSDPEIVQDLQLVMEHFARSMGAALAAMPTANMPPIPPDARKGAPPHAATDTHGRTRPSSATAASGSRQPDLAELATLVATLAAKIDAIEARLEQEPASEGSPPRRRRRKPAA